MPKQVNHAERQRHIAEAVLRVIATRGLEAVSLRDVAAEGHVSMGMVQHYFTSKDQMLMFACEYMVERAGQRVQERVGGLSGPVTPRALLRTMCVEILPLDEEHRAAVRVWIAFLARAVVEPDLAAFMRAIWSASHALFAGQIRDAQARGEIPAHRDPNREATAALALADGLVSHVLIGHYSPAAALSAIDDYLERLFSI